MVRAFVMVKTGAGTSETLRERLLEVAGVQEAHVVAGNFDLILEVGGDEVENVLHAVSTDVQSLDGVENTKTYICLE